MATEPDLEVKYARNAKVMVGSVILLFILIIIIILFRTYVYLCRRHRHRRHRHLFSPDPLTTTTTIPSKEESLDPSVLKSLPTFTYSSTTFSHQLQDCAVCLSEFSDGDECRTLPNCNHAFHSHCIDKWFASNSNCPLCRSPVQPVTVYSHVEPCNVSVTEAGEGCSQFPEPIGCPRKALGIIVELSGADSGSGNVSGNIGFKSSLKRLCNV